MEPFNISFFHISSWGIDLDYCNIMFALETNRDHSVIFQIAFKYCISDSFVDFDNNSSAGIDYLLKFKKDDLQELIANAKLESILKIVDSDTENLTTLDENEKLKIFDCVEDIVKYFVDFRLVYYQKRKDFLIEKLSKELRVLAFKAKFIKSIIDKKLVVNNVKKEVIIKWLDENKFEKIDDSYNYLLNMPIYSLTNERYMELMKNAKDKKEELDLIKDRYR